MTVICEHKATAVILRERHTIDGIAGTRFRRADGFLVYACNDEIGRLYCVSVRRGDSPTQLFYADDVQAIIL